MYVEISGAKRNTAQKVIQKTKP